MKTQYYLLLSLKTSEGFEHYGQYFLGNERDGAEVLFDSLSGDKNIAEASLLHIDLMETVAELPLKIKTISCNLDELARNIKLITREIFRQKNLRVYQE